MARILFFSDFFTKMSEEIKIFSIFYEYYVISIVPKNFEECARGEIVETISREIAVDSRHIGFAISKPSRVETCGRRISCVGKLVLNIF